MVKRNPLRFYFFFVQKFFKRHFKIILTVILLLAGAIYFLPKTQLTDPVLRIGLVGQYSREDLPLLVKKLISQGLTKVHEDGSISGQLAQDWQISEDEKTYTLKIKDNLKWDDGKTIKTEDIHYPYSDLNISYPDDKTLIIKLKDKFSPLLSLLAQPIFRKNLIGVGEYHVSQVKKRGQTIEAITLKKPGQNKKLQLKFYPTEEKLRNAFKLGEIDIIWGIKETQKIINYPNIKARSEISQKHYQAVFFNLKKDILAEKSFRQALAYATPKPQGKLRAKGPISRTSWAYNDFVKDYELDIDHAKKLLEDNDLNKAVEIELATLPNLLAQAEEIKSSWAKIGVTAKIRVVNFIPNDFEALLITQQTSDDPDQYWLWHSSQQKTNITNLANPRIDQLLEEGRQILDIKERREKYLDFQRFLLEESPAVFISYPTYYYIFRRGFEDYSLPLYNK